MRKIKDLITIWRFHRSLKGIEKFGLKGSDIPRGIDKKKDWEIGEVLNGTYYHNFGSE